MAARAETGKQFLALAVRSRLLDLSAINEYLRQLKRKSVLFTPDRIAKVLVRDGLLTEFQAAQLAQGRWKRFFLGPYKMLEPLGVGGMGTVFLAEHTASKQPMAVKLLLEGKHLRKGYLERFYREARASISLNHPNVVRAFELGRDGDVHYLVMEYVDGASLHQVVNRGRELSVVRAAHYVRQAALGLQYAFENGLVHRDVKPSNLMVDRAGNVKVLDLGLARFYDDSGDKITILHSNSRIGTLDFMAPEQVEDSHNADVRSDVYSLGATLYTCLTKQLPLGEGTDKEKLRRLYRNQRAPLAQLRPDVPPALAAVVTKMMAHDPGKRYPTPAAVAAALLPFASGPVPLPTAEEIPTRRWSPVADLPATPAAEERAPRRKRRLLRWALACLVLSGTAAAVAAWVLYKRQ
jgi:serine/threonine protein kinase